MGAASTAVVEFVGRRFEPTGSAVLGGASYPTFRRADFRWRWFATRLHTFVFVVELPTTTSEGVVALAEEARVWAREHKAGLPRGFQTGAAAMPVFIVPDIGPLRSWAEASQPLRFASPLFPVVIAADGVESAYRTRSQRVGFVYEPFFLSLATQLVAAARAAQ